MKELTKQVYHSDTFDIEINKYLTLAQIEAIAKAMCKFEAYVDRIMNRDLLLLHFATNLTDEEIQAHQHSEYMQSGLMGEVVGAIANVAMIDYAVEYMESLSRQTTKLLAQLPEYTKKLQEKIEAHSKK